MNEIAKIKKPAKSDKMGVHFHLSLGMFINAKKLNMERIILRIDV